MKMKVVKSKSLTVCQIGGSDLVNVTNHAVAACESPLAKRDDRNSRAFDCSFAPAGETDRRGLTELRKHRL